MDIGNTRFLRYAARLRSLGKALSPEGLKAEWQSVEAVKADGLKPLSREAARYLAALVDALVRSVEDGGALESLAAFDLAAWAARLDEAIRAPVLDVLERGYRTGLLRLDRVRPYDPEDARVREIAARAVRRAQSVPQTVRDLAETAARNAVGRGATRAEIVDAVRGAIRDVPTWKAEQIARTTGTDAFEGGMVTSYLDAGIRRHRWLSERDGNVRPEHDALDGEEVEVGEPFSNGVEWPSEPNCFPGDTLIEGALMAGLRGHYEGKLICIRTARGHKLRLTPNHPVLTPQGFVEAYALREGNEVISYSSEIGSGSENGKDNGPALAEEVFGTLAQDGFRLLRHVRPEDLHGDAVKVKGDIEVVGADGELLEHFDAALAKRRRQRGLIPPVLESAAVGRPRSSDLPLDRVGVTTSALPCGAHLGFNSPPPLSLDGLPLQPLRLGVAAQLDAFRFEPSGEERPTVIGLIRDLLERFPSFVSADEIVEVRDEAFSGHVYDFQSVYGWNVASGILISNCRCTTLPVVEDEPEPVRSAEPPAERYADRNAEIRAAYPDLCRAHGREIALDTLGMEHHLSPRQVRRIVYQST